MATACGKEEEEEEEGWCRNKLKGKKASFGPEKKKRWGGRIYIG